MLRLTRTTKSLSHVSKLTTIKKVNQYIRRYNADDYWNMWGCSIFGCMFVGGIYGGIHGNDGTISSFISESDRGKALEGALVGTLYGVAGGGIIG